MDGGEQSDTREARLALLNEMLHAVEVLEILITRFQDDGMTAEQQTAFEHWTRVLPELRSNLRVLYTSHFAQGAP